MQVMRDSCFVPLLQDSLWRRRVHDLMHRHAWDQMAEMSSYSKNKGVRLEIRLLDTGDNAVGGATVDVSPTSMDNPRWFACLRSSDSGKAAVETAWIWDGDETPALLLTVSRDGFETRKGLVVLRNPPHTADSSDLAWATANRADTVWSALKDPGNDPQRVYRAEVRLSRRP